MERREQPKHRACDHVYVINEEGRWLKKAFTLKSEGILSNREIIDHLKTKGVRVNEKNFRWIISNPFYAGYVTGNLVNGKLIKGHHPALVNLKTFLKANDLFKSEPTAGIAKSYRVEEAPLKIFAKDELSLCPLTAYIKKEHWYYKTRNKSGKLNINAFRLNTHFEDLLRKFEYSKKYKEVLSKLLMQKLTDKFGEALKDNIQLKKRIKGLEDQIEKLEERYVLGNLNKELFEKYSSKYNDELIKLRQESVDTSFDRSNLKMVVEKGMAIAENLSQLWLSLDFSNKQRLQYLIFPEGILYNKKKGTVRPSKVNSIFAEIQPLVKDTEDNKKGNFKKIALNRVPCPGLESNQHILANGRF